MLATILALTAMDYDHLARTIQVEAAKGTMDEYCVAVSVLNRVKSPAFPNNVSDVIHSSGQYEGLWKNKATVDHSLVQRLKDKSKMIAAHRIIGNRTDFKGQSMLRYRVASQDPMCDSRGNFYHYYWQS